ncbi:MAG: hypothetical protein ACRD28_07630 [Acidobacteriaceae bacterium]
MVHTKLVNAARPSALLAGLHRRIALGQKIFSVVVAGGAKAIPREIESHPLGEGVACSMRPWRFTLFPVLLDQFDEANAAWCCIARAIDDIA